MLNRFLGRMLLEELEPDPRSGSAAPWGDSAGECSGNDPFFTPLGSPSQMTKWKAGRGQAQLTTDSRYGEPSQGRILAVYRNVNGA
jgi:hypothetical protein